MAGVRIARERGKGGKKVNGTEIQQKMRLQMFFDLKVVITKQFPNISRSHKPSLTQLI